jgi:hypothetical protein
MLARYFLRSHFATSNRATAKAVKGAVVALKTAGIQSDPDPLLPLHLPDDGIPEHSPERPGLNS